MEVSARNTLSRIMHERDLFIAAMEIDDETARRAYLETACVNDPVLRDRVEWLLNCSVKAGNFLEQPAADLCADSDVGLFAKSDTPGQADGDPPTILAQAGDTGRTLLEKPDGSVASASRTKADAILPSGLNAGAAALGTLFGRYRVERVLGSGGMGIVYLAEDLRLGRRVALKIPKFDAEGKLHLSERFRREARTMGSVQHRNLCPIYDVDEQDGTHYLTMAFVDGETLAQVISSRSRETSDRTLTSSATPSSATTSFSSCQIAELIRKLALGLEAAHRAGIVHRDLKPANVMIDRKGEPILMDFGLAWMTHETDARVTQSGAILGTPAYMSPEQAEGEPDKIGASTDIYSLGAILYEMLVGRPVFTGSVTNVLYKVRHETPIRPSVIRSEVDPQLEDICWTAISRRSEDRFATAGEFAEALAGFLADPSVRRTPPRSRWRTTLVGFAAIVLLAAIVLISTRNGTVVVNSPDGQIPDDVKVVVTRDGNEIELLHADNHWSAKLVNGEYQVQLKGGDDRFEITTSQLTINRLDRAVVTLKLRPPVTVANVPKPKTATGPVDAPRSAIVPTGPPMIGTGPHLPLAPNGVVLDVVPPAYDDRTTSFTGTWGLDAPVAWRGSFTGVGPMPRDNTGSHSTSYDFSGLPGSVLSAGSYFAITDLDTVEQLSLTAYDTTHTVITSPWLNLYPLSQWGKGTGEEPPGQILPTDLPGWAWHELTHTYHFHGRQVAGNPAVSFALSSREAIGFLDVKREITGFNFHLMAPGFGAPRLAVAPFEAQPARAHQAAWAEHLGVEVEYTNSIGMKFVLIPPGEFMMGSPPAEIAEAVAVFGTAEDQTWHHFFRSEAPQHTVHLTQPFYLGVHEVTQAEYELVLGKDRNRSCFAPGSFGGDEVVGLDTTRHPVEMVSWNDATEFCAKLSEKEPQPPTSPRENELVTPLEGIAYRLPTEAQWEFACRAGTVTKYWTGTTDQDLERTGWFNLNSGGRTHAVGELPANPFGLYDMHGNVEEWVQDHYAAYPEKRTVNPSITSTTEIRRVTRGGVWTFRWPLCRSSYRGARAPDSRFNDTGFRVTLEVEAVKAAIAKRTP